MDKKRLMMLVVLSILGTVVAWENKFDKYLKFICPKGHYISKIESSFSGAYNDRRWAFKCRPGLVSNDCYWFKNYSNFDRDIDVTCPGGDCLIIGLKAHHDNWHEDRKFMFRYCKVSSCQLFFTEQWVREVM